MLGVRRVLMKKNGKAIEGIGSIVRYGDTSFSFFFFRGGIGLAKILVNILCMLIGF